MNASFERQIADIIWKKLKGKELPAHYSDEEIRNILDRYWHRAMESEQ
jgi:hypothetical protein